MKQLILLSSLIILLAACNTFQGMGKDIENAGQGLSDSARAVKDEINK